MSVLTAPVREFVKMPLLGTKRAAITAEMRLATGARYRVSPDST